MKKIVIILAFINCFLSCAKEKPQDYNTIVSKFQSYYNNQNYDAIFNLYSNKMKAFLPVEKNQQFFTKNVRSIAGNWNDSKLIKTSKKGNIYKLIFEKTSLLLSITLDKNNAITGFLMKPDKTETPILKRNITKMILPFYGEWTVAHGGTNIKENYHVAHENQKYAYDLVITKNGKTNQNNRSKNESFYAFGQNIISPCDAKVVQVVTNILDNIPGEQNKDQPSGNVVILETSKKEYIKLSHFKANSIIVKQGQYVKQGELLGQCGNSGNSTEPHLHINLQNILQPYKATGAKLYFNKILVNNKIKEDYIPIKNEKIQNVKL